MATPIVAGIAAMVRSYNPEYDYLDTINAIKSGGVAIPALEGLTTTGKAANAIGALAHINPPTGLTSN